MAKKKYHYDAKRNRWDTSIYIVNEFGVKQRIALHARTYEELDKLVKVTKEKAENDKSWVEKSKTILADYAAHWLEENKFYLTPKTLSSYNSHLKLYILPVLGKKRLAEITLEDVQNMLNSIAANGGVAGGELSKSTLIGIRNTLRACLNHAGARGYISNNPVNGTRIPRARGKAKKLIVSAEKLMMLLQVAKKGDYLYNTTNSKFQNSPQRDYLKNMVYHAISVAVNSAMRFGEVFSMRWESVDFERGTASVVVNITEVGKIYEGDPKNHQYRDIKLPQSVMVELMEWKKYWDEYAKSSNGTFRTEQGFVFANSVGGFMRNSNFRKRYWLKLMKACDFPAGFTFHSLRHNHISLLLGNGVNLSSVANRAGHLDASVTERIYMHEIEENDNSALETWEDLGF